MKIDDTIRDENYNMVLRKKQQKYQHYHPETLPPDQRRVIDKVCIFSFR